MVSRSLSHAAPQPVPQRARRGLRRRVSLAAAALALVPLAWGCTATVTPPVAPADPTTVFLLREAMHTGVVFPPRGDEHEWVEFGFGDWSWFALGNDAWYHAFATVLWPTQGALGRRTFRATDAAQLRARVHWAELSPLVVDGARLRAVRARLEQEHERRLGEAARRPDLGWTFVPYERSYWFPQNCADLAGEWCVELGCELGWVPICTGLAVAPLP